MLFDQWNNTFLVVTKSGTERDANFINLMEQHALKNVYDFLNTSIYPYLETSGGQSSNPYLNVVHFLNTRAN
jgi:hypothetical protein